MNFIFSEDLLKLVLSLLMGCLVGFEREYRSKAAGFRTMTLICIGSTLFTIVSIRLGGITNPDRIAAGIISGIGFIGAGIVFKDSMRITGLTTATCIWATAALGMAIGSGDYIVAVSGLVLIMIVLSLFEYVQDLIDAFHQKRYYKIIFVDSPALNNEIEEAIKEFKIILINKREIKRNGKPMCFYDICGRHKNLDNFNKFLLDFKQIKSFSY